MAVVILSNLHLSGGHMKKLKSIILFLAPKIPRYYQVIMIAILLVLCCSPTAFAADDMWTVANDIIKDVYNQIAGISTVLAGLMSAVAVIGAKISNNQHKVDQAWDWLKRIWIAWLIINGIGAFIAYVRPLLSGWNNLEGTKGSTSE